MSTDNTNYRYADKKPMHHPGITPTVPGHFENDQYVFFWSGPFSNWDEGFFSMNIEDALVTFNCSEQAMMYVKAFVFGDFASAKKIMKETSPREQKKLGRKVQPFDQDVWEATALKFFPFVLAAKFSQVPGYKEILLNTGTKTIVEASPMDHVWGIKMGVNHPDLLDESKWQGKNLLGKCLEIAREIVAKNMAGDEGLDYMMTFRKV